MHKFIYIFINLLSGELQQIIQKRQIHRYCQRSFRIMEVVLLKAALRGVADAAYFITGLNQRCQTCIRVILYILYYKVYNSSCNQVGHDLIDHVQSLPEPIKVTASRCNNILCDDGSASCSGIDTSMQ